ncbi:hypothetical protein MKW94_020215 [Papaver nudicaule]|uniref:Pentatricopeptide repeat-containing protein n=1 Tax=Papaver nudicaule TaxID=74823 RepID=A0AA41V312_PAPNU|nr:hypothetical protein [Papaver nudicaule]
MPRRNSTSYTAMIAGLSRSGFVAESRKVFDSIPPFEQNVYSWTAMISSYTHNRQHMDALKLCSVSYGEFFPWILPNSFTFSTVLNYKENVFVQNCLIDLHGKLGNLGDAENVFNGLTNLMIVKALAIFDSMEEKDTLSWNIMISGLAECGRGIEALEFFLQLCRLQGPGTYPNSSTFTLAITICGTYSMLKTGVQIHACVLKRGLTESNSYTGNSLINMYMKCGSIEESERLFYDMPRRDVISWNSLILCLGQNGHSKKAMEMGEKALSLGIYNHNTFIALLTSCSHGGLVDEGIEYFGAMSKSSGIEPFLDHYVCVIDMLGRAGKVVEALNFLRKMPISPNAIAWSTLLSASLVHGNKEIGEVAAHELRILEPSNSASYVMLGNLYRKTGHFEDSNQILELMNKIDLKKEKGISWTL